MSWPSGVVRFDGETLEFGAGETRRVHISSLREIETKPPRAGRLSLAIAYQAGLNREKVGVWVEVLHEAAPSALVASVRAAMSVVEGCAPDEAVSCEIARVEAHP